MLLRHMLHMLLCFWVIQSLIIINLGWREGGELEVVFIILKNGHIQYNAKFKWSLKTLNKKNCLIWK